MQKIATIILFSFFTNLLPAAEIPEVLFLSGPDSDHPVEWEFMVSDGRQSGQWSTIPVPSCWELQGFGTFNYGHDQNKGDEEGRYRHSFQVPSSWKGNHVFVVFEGAMTDTEVRINGSLAGPVHRGGFYRFKYEIQDLLDFNDADNLLEVTVRKNSADETINEAERSADYWVFGGIYRPVYLEAFPTEYIDRVAIDARHDGDLRIEVHPGNISTADRVTARIVTPEGLPLSEHFSSPVQGLDEKIILENKIKGQTNWSAESPALYYADITLMRGDTRLHTLRERFGFRTIQIRPGEGIFLNDSRIVLKGVDRHSFRPHKGRALSRNDCLDDVLNIKAMNMNAVRMSHYPPDTYFLDLCDEHGLYVLDELAGWQKPPYSTPTGERLVEAMVSRDVNHPCILFWDNGNEGGWNQELDDDFSRYDPQKRPVLHPFELHGGIDTDHYEDYESVSSKLSSGNIFMPTEHLHGLYDGGLGAGLDDFWKLMQGHPLNGGMFLWVFADEGVVRGDLNGKIDTDGNHAPDGILGPNGEKEASFYTIREIWSPFYIESGLSLPPDFRGSIPVQNRFDFSNLNKCRVEWELARFHDPASGVTGHLQLAAGEIPGPDLSPGEKGTIDLDLPPVSPSADALFLKAYDWNGRLINTWSWQLASSKKIIGRIVSPSGPSPSIQREPHHIAVTAGITTFRFNPENGLLLGVQNGTHQIPFGQGPILQPGVTVTPKSASRTTVEERKSSVTIKAIDHPSFKTLQWTIYGSGWLKLDYEYEHSGPVDYMGISFSYPEERMKGMTWLGNGPYRVWKNRLKGGTVDVWENSFRVFPAGTSWDYPEFPGYYSNFRWVGFDTTDLMITLATESPNLFLRVYRQENGEDPRHTAMKWPSGNISLLHAIPAVGTKFHAADRLGPQGETFQAEGDYSGTAWFYFGRPPSP